MKKLVTKIPNNTYSELNAKNVTGPAIVSTAAVIMQTIIVGALKLKLVRFFSITGPEITPKEPANKATKPY